MDIAPLTVSIPEACRLIGCGRTMLYELVKTRQLSVVKLGKRTLVPIAALRALIEAKVREAA